MKKKRMWKKNELLSITSETYRHCQILKRLAKPMDDILETFPMDEDEATRSKKDENNPEDGGSNLEPDATKPVCLFVDLDLWLIRSRNFRSRRHGQRRRKSQLRVRQGKL
jgi:hypothetical protein